jgi:hypothetical protein
MKTSVDAAAPRVAADQPRRPRVAVLLNTTALLVTTALPTLQDVPKRPSGSGD